MPRIDIKIGDYFVSKKDGYFKIIDFDGVFARAIGKHQCVITVDVRSDGTIRNASGSMEILEYATEFEYLMLQVQ